MIAALLLGFALFAVALYFHMWMLRGAKALSPPGKDPRHLRLLAGSSLVLASHLVIAGIFAGGMYLASVWGLGALEEDVIEHEITPTGPRELSIETHDYEAHESTMVLPFEDTHACLLQSRP